VLLICKLQTLDLSQVEINDQGIDILVPALKKCDHLHFLSLENDSITSKGLQKLTALLVSPKSNFKGLYIAGNSIDDEVVTAFTSALVNNHKLETLNIRNYNNPYLIPLLMKGGRHSRNYFVTHIMCQLDLSIKSHP